MLRGIIGKDFPEHHMDLFKKRNICTEGIEVPDGDCFRWSGEYFDDLNTRTTHDVALNVLENFEPKVPHGCRDSKIVVLANMSPQNQIDAIGQCENPDFTITNTMDLWINIARDQLSEMLTMVDMLVINESEAREFMDTRNLVTDGKKLLETGPKFVAVKTGEHGALLFSKDGDFFRCGAYPHDEVADPTGVGDCFLGGHAGYLCSLEKPDFSFADLNNAIVHGTIIASFNCESFSTDRLIDLTTADIESRNNEIRDFSAFQAKLLRRRDLPETSFCREFASLREAKAYGRWRDCPMTIEPQDIIRYLHFASIFVVVSAVVSQHLMLTRRMSRAEIKRVQRIDIAYAAAVVAVLATGLLQWFSVGKPAEFYSKNPVFHIKITLFLVVGLVSAYPSVFLGRNKKGDPSETVTVPVAILWSVRTELALIFLMPLLATLMARGVGYSPS